MDFSITGFEEVVFDSRFEVFWTTGSKKIDSEASFLSAKIFFLGLWPWKLQIWLGTCNAFGLISLDFAS